MELTNQQLIHSGKSEVFLGEYEGQNYIKKTCRTAPETGEALPRVSSPFAARVFECGEDYMLMEYAEGVPLSEAAILPKEIYGIACELCEGLSALHSQGIIHRDIKPSNIILTNERHVKIIDFDAARLRKPAADKDTVFVGTDGFAPPEQFGFTQTDERSDIYALGVTLKLLLREHYERSPYRGVIEKCTRFNPEQRYRSAKDVKSALVRRKYLWAVVAACAVLCAVGVVFAVSLVPAKNEAPAESAAPEISAVSGNAETSEAVQTAEALPPAPPVYDKPAAPAESRRDIPWEILALPEDFPRLADGVTEFSYNGQSGFYEFSWDIAGENEDYYMERLLLDRFGITPEYEQSRDARYYKNDDYSVYINYNEPDSGRAQIQLTVQSFGKVPAVFPAFDMPSELPEGSVRDVRWEELGLPEDFPKLTDSVSEWIKEPYRTAVRYDLMSLDEAAALAYRLSRHYNTGYAVMTCYDDGITDWSFDGYAVSMKYLPDEWVENGHHQAEITCSAG